MHPETVTERRLAFDTRLYIDRPNIKQRATSDLAALVLETAPKPEDRISPYTLVQTGESTIECPEFAKGDILETLGWTEVTSEIRSLILSHEAPFVIVWISPPEEELKWPESRMVVGIGKEKSGVKTVECYGLCPDFSPKACLWLGNRLSLLSENRTQPEFNSTNQLRATPLLLKPPEWLDPLNFIAGLIPLTHVWKKIKSGEVKETKDRVIAAAQPIINEAISSLIQAESYWEFIAIGAWMEQQMAIAGFPMRSGSGCGALNSELLTSGFATSSQTYLGANKHHQNLESGKFVRKCPYCGRTINAVIYSGYTCACGQTYRGVC